MGEGRRRAGAGDGEHPVHRSNGPERLREPRDEGAGVGQVDVVRARLDRGSRQRGAAVLKRPGGVDRQPWSDLRDRARMLAVDRSDVERREGAAGFQVPLQALQRVRPSRGEDEFDAMPRQHGGQAAAEHAGRADQQDARGHAGQVSSVARRARNSVACSIWRTAERGPGMANPI